MKTTPKLIFTMQLKKESRLISGNLALDYGDKNIINYLATSGIPGRQTKDWIWKQGGGGPIPEGDYWIPTIGYFSATPGIQGMFFHIQPDPISPLGKRSELGIHWDARNPGTMGCIGILRQPSFERLCDRLEEIHDSGDDTIPLLVRY